MTVDESPRDGDRSPETEDGPATEPRLQFEFHSEGLAEPFRDRFETDVIIDVFAVVPLEDGTHLQYWTVTHADVERLLETVVEFPTTLDVRLLSTSDETHRLEVVGSSDSLFSAFDEFDGVTRTAVYDESGVRVRAELPAAVETDSVVAAVRDIYPDLELVSSRTVETVHVFRRLVEDRLTARQLTALRLAYYGGYYAKPRTSTGEELAARMDISKQAFHEHLRKAYATVFEALLEDDVPSTEVDQ